MKTKIVFLFFALLAATSGAQSIFVANADGSYDFTADTTIVLKTDSAFITYRDSFGLKQNDTMKITFSETDAADTLKEYLTYKQYYKGYEVEQAEFHAQAREEKLQTMLGRVIPDLNLDVTNPIAEDSAIAIALDFIDADEYAWENGDYEFGLQSSTGNPAATWYPEGNLLIGRVNHLAPTLVNNYAFAWKFDILVTLPYAQSYSIYVNAKTAAVSVGCFEANTPAPDLNNYDLQGSLSDEFTAASPTPDGLDASKWGFDYYCKNKSINQPANLSFVANVTDVLSVPPLANVVRITTKAEANPIQGYCTIPPDTNPTLINYNYSSAAFDSREMFLYGYMEFRCKFPSQLRKVSQDYWYWGEWHSLPNGNGYSSIDHYSEIDVIEHFQWSDWDVINGDSSLARMQYPTNIHDGPYGSTTANPPCVTASSGGERCYKNNFNYNTCLELWQKFHTFGMAWSPSSVTFYMDGHALPDVPNTYNGGASIHKVIKLFRECNTSYCMALPATENVSEIKAMYAIIAQSVRDLVNPPLLDVTEIMNWDIDYFRYYKRKPDITGSCFTSVGDTRTFTASMYNGAATNNTYTWSVSSNASFSPAGANTGASVNITMNSGTSVAITVTASETGPGYVNDSGNPYYWNAAQTARTSSRTTTVNLVASQPPSLSISVTTLGTNVCQKFGWVIETTPYAIYQFSVDGGNTWTTGNEQPYTNPVTNITHDRWVYDSHPFGISNSTQSFLVRARGCGTLYSPATSHSFNYTQPPSGCRLESINQHNISGFNLHPNPANNELTLKYELAENERARIEFANIHGSVIAAYDLENNSREMKIGTARWNGGIYFCRLLKPGGESEVQKLVVIK